MSRRTPDITALVAPIHEATIAYVSTPIGDSDFPMTTYFADVGDVTALQPVNMAQREYVENYIAKNLPQYAGIPVLSAAAPFKGGFGGPTDYTDIAAGPLAIHNAADLYLYPNTLTAVKIDGAMLKGWLEHAAGRFNRVDPAKSEPQELVNRTFPSYNFDVIQGGITYAIDVTEPDVEPHSRTCVSTAKPCLWIRSSSSSPTTIAPAAAAVFRASTDRTLSCRRPTRTATR